VVDEKQAEQFNSALEQFLDVLHAAEMPVMQNLTATGMERREILGALGKAHALMAAHTLAIVVGMSEDEAFGVAAGWLESFRAVALKKLGR